MPSHPFARSTEAPGQDRPDDRPDTERQSLTRLCNGVAGLYDGFEPEPARNPEARIIRKAGYYQFEIVPAY